MRSRAVLAYSLLFFLSGATGLVYELLWVRLLYQAFGSTIQSVTTVVAAYMGGLGLGAWLFGRLADRHQRPAAVYGWLEIAIAAFGALSPFVLALVRAMYIALARGLHSGAVTSVALRFGLAALILLVPTTLMGGTLPVLTRALAGPDRDALKRSLGRLYGLNTLGAVLGSALAGFVLVEFVGIRVSLWGTAAVNLALGVTALAWARPIAPVAPAATAPPIRDPLQRLVLALLALTAFAALLDEIAWTRVLVMIVGGSTYAFTLVLVVFLLGVAIGSALVARSRTPRLETAASAGGAQALTAGGAALLFLFFSWLPLYIVDVFQIAGLNAGGRLALMGLAIGAVVLIPAVGMGMTFPLLTDIVAPEGESRGADVGRAYALNTLGSIVGAALTGFVLVVWLGTDVTLRLGVVIDAAAAIALVAAAAKGVPEGSAEHRRLRVRVLGGGALAMAALVAALAAPQWSTRLIDLGPTIYARGRMTPEDRRGFLNHTGARQLDFREGWNATASVWESPAGRTLKVNGKADASDHGDMDTQILIGLAPAIAHPHPQSALVIGFGSGVTTRTLADVPGMARVRVVELEPAVLGMAPHFAAVNGNVLARAAVSAVVDDARSALQIDAARYDLIVSEPSNPWVAGVATLYTPEFFRIARARLADDGVFCQWVQLYQLPLPVVAAIVRNVRAVFPHVQVWYSSPWDLMVMGSAHSITYDRTWLDQVLQPASPLGTAAREYLGVTATDEYFGHLALGEAGVQRLLASGVGEGLVHRDDRPRLEFVAARRFLDSRDIGSVFDSLLAIAAVTHDAATPAQLAAALTSRRGDLMGYSYVDALRRALPAGQRDRWTVEVAAMWLASGDSAFPDTALPRLAARGNGPALLLSGLVALRRGQLPRAHTALAQALIAGADSATALSGLAVAASKEQRWGEASTLVAAALAHARDTFRHSFPRELLGEALRPLAFNGVTATTDSLISRAMVLRPGWATLYELRAVTALREGDCDAAVRQFETLLEFGIDRPDGPGLVARCRRGEHGGD